MNRLKFSIDIQADKAQIWNALWKEESYREWAGIFFAGSYILVTNWEVGSTIRFLSPDKTGIYSRIKEHIPNSSIRFKHIGNVVDEKEQPLDEEAKKWTGATEIYSITEGLGTNTLSVEIDVMDEHLEFMNNTFPKALEKVKELSTQQ